MDVTQALKDTENSLRDFIAEVLRAKYGDQWPDKCGVSSERLRQWRDRKQVEEKRQDAGVVEERLIYYADFYDLQTILKKHWPGVFAEAFGEWKRMEVWLTELERLRDPDAHRRELLPHQKNLAVGIAGDIRTRLIRYRSKMETSDDYYPRIESARDSLGNICVFGKSSMIDTGLVLRVGDTIDFVITAYDPFDEPVEFRIRADGRGYLDTGWQTSNEFTITLAKEQVSKNTSFLLEIRSPREFHASEDVDDYVIFTYEVLPPKP